MKKIIIILIAVMLMGLAGCIGTKIYLGKEQSITKDLELLDEGPIARAIDPTTVPAGGTWGTVRGILNTNFSNINGTLDSVEVTLAEFADSITNYSADIALRTLIGDVRDEIADSLNVLRPSVLFKSDSTLYATQSDLAAIETGAVDSAVYATRNYVGITFAPIANPVFTGIQKVSTTDTLATMAYARQYGGTGTVTISDVQDEIADSLNVLRPLTLVGDATAGPFFDGSSDGGQLLYFYGDNGFYTALQGGAPTANRSYRLPIAALPSAGTTSLLNIDENGNMGFVASATFNAATVTGFTPASGSLTLSGADALTFTTTATTGVTLPTSGTLATIENINDSLDARIGGGVELSDVAIMIADSTGNAVGNYVTRKALIDSLAANPAGLSSGAVATMINDSIQARLDVAVDGVRLADSVNYVNGYMSRYDGVTGLATKINVADSTGNAPGNYVTRKALVDSLNAIAGGLVIGDVRDEIADSLNALRPSILTEADLRKYDSDTTTLFVFGAGSGGAEADTALFTASNIYGSFYNAGSDTLVVTSLRAVMIAGTTPLGTDTLSIQIYWNDTINVTTGNSFVVLNTDPLGINSTTTGTVDSSFDNSAIPPNVWVFCKSPGVVTGRKPKALIVNMTGYKRNRSY